MIKVAIVEDEAAAADTVRSFLARFSKERGMIFTVDVFDNALMFLDSYRPGYDLVFMDIELPDLNGLEASRILRDIDNVVTLIFVTNMAQFAVKGYEVDALDFIVKPVAYYSFALKLQKAVDRIESIRDKELGIALEGGGLMRLRVSRIQYIEITGHNIVYHSEDGTYNSYGTLKNIEPLLNGAHFVRCNSCYLVNLKYVYSVKGYTADVAGQPLRISQPRKKEFMRALNDYIGGGFDVPV